MNTKKHYIYTSMTNTATYRTKSLSQLSIQSLLIKISLGNQNREQRPNNMARDERMKTKSELNRFSALLKPLKPGNQIAQFGHNYKTGEFHGSIAENVLKL